LHHVPLHRDRIAMQDVTDLLSLYRDFLRICGDSFATVANLLGDPDAFPALIHCSAGKDRTGLVIAIILSTLGVPDTLVAEDYGRTAEVFTGEYRDRLLAESVTIGVDPQRLALMSGSPPTVMRAICAELAAEYGGATAYLAPFGAKPEALQHLREVMTIHP
jgi:protein-tyrosine phosphatase